MVINAAARSAPPSGAAKMFTLGGEVFDIDEKYLLTRLVGTGAYGAVA